jgi:hypothetical protein
VLIRARRFHKYAVWPPRSPDSQLQLFLWGYLNENIYKSNTHSLDELKTSKTILNVSTVIVHKVASNMKKRLDACISEHGRHVQHFL